MDYIPNVPATLTQAEFDALKADLEGAGMWESHRVHAENALEDGLQAIPVPAPMPEIPRPIKTPEPQIGGSN